MRRRSHRSHELLDHRVRHGSALPGRLLLVGLLLLGVAGALVALDPIGGVLLDHRFDLVLARGQRVLEADG